MALRRLRFLGIGGVGMSALAEHFHRRGHQVSGYDREPSPQTVHLQTLNIPVDFTPRVERLSEVDAVIYTPAISSDFEELMAAHQNGIPCLRRAEALALAVEPYEVLAVAGAHGKTSTSAILAWLLHAVGASPTAFVGGRMQNFGSTYLYGEGPQAVVEADEYDRAMLRLSPAHAIITSTEPDHLEIYGTAAEVLSAYRAFRTKVRGLCIVPEAVQDIQDVIQVRLHRYSREKSGQATFVYDWQGHRREAVWSHLGRVYAENAALALTLLEAMGWAPGQLLTALADYKGVSRRLEWQLIRPDLAMVLDYAHHPTEIRRTIETLREDFSGWQVIVLFQPHLYSRTAFFAKEFALALEAADQVFLFPIYPAREPYTPHISAKTISQHLHNAVWEVVDLTQVMSRLCNLLREPSVVVVMGAGDIYTIWDPLIKQLLV